MDLIFEWDKKKADSNLRKHGISFDEATTIFKDPRVITFRDDFHSDTEERFISIGTSLRDRVLLAINTEQQTAPGALVIRIISCRKATPSERSVYEQGE